MASGTSTITLTVKGLWRFKVCVFVTKIYVLVLNLAGNFLPKPSRNPGTTTLFVDLVARIREAK